MKLRSVLVAFGIVAACTGAALADETFDSPMTGGKPLDWCQTFQKGCGKLAADTFCKKKGFSGASSFEKAEDVGLTRTIGDGSVCEDDYCDSFTQITCEAKQAASSFSNPTIKGTRLDWCREWTTNCGKPAADAFCEMKGMSSAASFKKASNLPKTRVITSGQVCEGGKCDGFSKIACK